MGLTHFQQELLDALAMYEQMYQEAQTEEEKEEHYQEVQRLRAKLEIALLNNMK